MTQPLTPGPWQAKEFCSPAGTYFVVNPTGTLVVGAGKQIHRSDALLIAAAPELLAALKFYEDEAISGHHAEFVNEWTAKKFQDMASAAIAKAEGR